MASREGLAQIARLARFGLGVKRLGKAEMREFLRVLLSNAADLILDEMPDGPLAGLLAADALRGASAGPRAPGTVFSMIYRMGHGGRASQPIGGMGRVIDMLAGAVRTAGCRIETGARAARVLLEGDRVIGVETEAGTRFSAPLILSNLAPLKTAHLAGLEHFDIEATKRMHKLRTKGAVAKINLRLSALPRFTGLPEDIHSRARIIHAPGVDFVETAFNPSKYGEMSAAPVIEAVFPSATDPTLSPADGHVMSLIVQYAPYALAGGWDDAARQRLLGQTLDMLDAFAPGLTDMVTESEILAPPDIEALTGIPGGHWHHCEMSLDQLFALRPGNGMGHYRMGPKGLYLCGASTHPGGDLMGLAGLNAARLALTEEARP
jgi:phytoene dehydrogenase-like protein